MTWHEKAALVSLPWCWTTVWQTQDLQQKVTFLWSIKYKALPDRKNAELQWVTNMFPYRNLQLPKSWEKMKSWLWTAPEPLQTHKPKQTPIWTSPKLGIGQYSYGLLSLPRAGNTELPPPNSPAFNTRLGRTGLCSHLPHSTTGTWKWAFPCNGVEKAAHWSGRK